MRAPVGDYLLRDREVASMLAVSRATVWRLVAAGHLPAIRLGGATRFHRADVAALVERGREEASGKGDQERAV